MKPGASMVGRRSSYSKFIFIGVACTILFATLIAGTGMLATLSPGREIGLGKVFTDEVSASSQRTYSIPQLDANFVYELLISADEPGTWDEAARLDIKLALPAGKQTHKVLHTGDPDMYLLFQPAAEGAGTVEVSLSGAEKPVGLKVLVSRLPVDRGDFVAFGRKPASSWQEAREMRLGRTVFAATDEIEYLDNRDEGKTGIDWYWFEVREPKPQLVMFDIDVLDRDVPVNLRLYREVKTGAQATIEEYTEGKDPEEIRHDLQLEINSKLITRVIRPGKYYLEVKANHPAYQLRTYLHDVPPYDDPRQAVRTAMDYLIAESDSWFAHTPRGGSRKTRVENVTDETERCVACHAGHFPMRGSLEGVKNGYPVAMRPQFKFMIDKLYNSMAPFYGHANTQWLRFDLAPTNGIGRMARMILYYENYFSHRATPRPEDAAGYLKLAYRDRKELPGNEFDGNRPISRFKVAADAWYDLDEFYKRTGKAEYRETRDKIKSLLLSVEPKDLEDVCEQTIAMLQTGDPTFAPRIKENVQKIFDAQHDDGAWWTPHYAHAGRYDPKLDRLVAPVPPEQKSDPGLQFMTADVIYTLVKAGVPLSNPHLKKALDYFLPKQKNFGGWLDNRGELFLTPFLETKWSVKALSTAFPFEARPAHSAAETASFDPARASLLETLDWLDNLWDVHDEGATRKAIGLLSSPYVIVREAAASALGKMAVDAGQRREVEMMQKPLLDALDDPSKLVSRAAAWSLRQILNDGYAPKELLEAMAKGNDRTRRGSTRVFAQYFYLALPHTEYLQGLLGRTADPDLLVRIQATKATWRWYYRTQEPALRASILDTLLARMPKESSAYERLNLSQALYTILDDNTSLMYNYWLPKMGRGEDRRIAQEGQYRHEMLLASKIAPALERGNAQQKESILDAFGYYFLRGEIGNDYDVITFYNADAADMMVEPLLKLLNDPSERIREKAVKAAVAARGARDVRLKAAVLERVMDSDSNVRTVAGQAVPRFPTVTKPLIEVEYVTDARPAPEELSPYANLGLFASLGSEPGVLCPISLLKPRLRFAFGASGGKSRTLTEQQLPVILPILEEMMKSPIPAARAAALDWIERDPVTQTEKLAALMLDRARTEDQPKVLAKFVSNLGWIIPKYSSAYETLRALARNQTADVQEALFELLRQKQIETDPRTPELFARIMRDNRDDPNTHQRVMALLLEPQATESNQERTIARELRKNQQVLVEVAVIARRGHPAEAVKASAILEKAYAEAGSKKEELRRAVEAGLAARLAQLPPVNFAPAERQVSEAEPLDFPYFVARVEPILEKMHGDRRCMDCHAVSTNLSKHHLTRPLATGQYTEAHMRSNYASLLTLVDPQAPEQSPLLGKPLAEEAGGDPIHAGGKYWATRADPEYQTVLAWINGARLASPSPEDQKELSRIVPLPRAGMPDFKEFEQKIQSILDKKYDLAQGQSCVSCHSQRRDAGDFHLIPPDERGEYTPAKLYANYLSTVEFMDLRNVEQSLILLKPLNPIQVGGVLNNERDIGTLHAGGAVWINREDPDYLVIERWARPSGTATRASR